MVDWDRVLRLQVGSAHGRRLARSLFGRAGPT